MPKVQENSEPSWFGFLITLKDQYNSNRTKTMQKLEEAKIQTRLLFAGNIVKQPCFDEMRLLNKGFRVIGDLTNTDKVMKDSFWIGVYPDLTYDMIEYMIRKIIESLK